MTKEELGGKKPLKRILLSTILFFLALTSATVKARKFTFTQPGEDSPTILVKADFIISIKAFEKDMVVAAWVGGTDDHPDLEVFGISGKRSEMELVFPSESISWGLILNEKSLQDVSIKRIVKFTPEKIFPPFADLNYPLTFEDKSKEELLSALKSFRCDGSVTRIYEAPVPLEGHVYFEVSVTVSNFQLQAYNIKDGEFGPAQFCKEDWKIPTTTPSHLLTTTKPTTPKPTTSKPTTPKPTTPKPTTPKPTPPYLPIPGGNPKHKFVANQTIDNKTSILCISMEGRVGFEIAYYTYDGRYQTSRKLVKVGIPQSVKTDGICQQDTGTQKLIVNFLNNWEMEIIFGLNVAYSLPSEQGDHQSKLDYSMKSVSLKYNIGDKGRFPQALKVEGSNFSVGYTEHQNLPRKKAASGFFVCNTPKRFRMSDDVTLVMSELKFKAFISNGDTHFYGSPAACEEDMKEIGASTLIVVVGCLVITFSLIVFIALLALISAKCRTKRRRRKYAAF